MNSFLEKIKARRKMPKVKEEYWYCGEWYMYEGDKKVLPPYENTFLVDPFNWNGSGTIFSRLDNDALIPFIKVNGFIGLYKMTSRPHCDQYYYDGAPWDDGKKINLKLEKIVLEEGYDITAWKGEIPLIKVSYKCYVCDAEGLISVPVNEWPESSYNPNIQRKQANAVRPRTECTCTDEDNLNLVVKKEW